jgi:Rad3-related DNA helicase
LVKRVLEKRCRESPTNTLNSSKEELKRIIGTLKRIIKERGRYRVFVDEEAGIQALPIDLPYLFNAAFEYVPTIIGISSTIGSLEYWRNVTGLPYDDIVMISAPPTIPKANRPFYVLEDGVALSEDELKNPETIQRVLEIITKLLKVPCNIIIHPHTIEIGRKIASQLMKLDGFKERVITHTPLLDGFGDSYYTSEEAVERFKRRGGILVSTVVKEGQDFPYDKARLQIIVKMPFPDITAPYVNAMKEKYGEEWYNWQVVRDLEQAYGRIVRAEDDWGVTVCVDTNFRWFFGKNLKSFDRWFTEAVRSATTDEVVATLQKRLGKC